MKYFRDEQGDVFGYDEGDETQLPLIEEATSRGWTDVTGSWPPAPTIEQLAGVVTRSVQVEMDLRAKAKGYDNILSACSYAALPVGAPFQAEGAAFLAWRSAVWAQTFATLAEVEAGQRAMPTTEDAVAAMPALQLPA